MPKKLSKKDLTLRKNRALNFIEAIMLANKVFQIHKKKQE